MNANYAMAIVTTAVGLFSSAVYAQSTTYSDIPKAFGVASAGPVAQPNSVSSGFETSWLHLRDNSPCPSACIFGGTPGCATDAGTFECK